MSDYNIKVKFNEETFNFVCPGDQDVNASAKINGIDLPDNCCSGVCKSYASMPMDGSVEKEDAMGLNDDLIEKGFALLCEAHSKLDLCILIGDAVEDNLYDNQFGRYQKWHLERWISI